MKLFASKTPEKGCSRGGDCCIYNDPPPYPVPTRTRNFRGPYYNRLNAYILGGGGGHYAPAQHSSLSSLQVTWRMAFTTTILNSSAISFMKDEICFISLSTDPSDPVLRSVVMARVAIDLVSNDFCLSASCVCLLRWIGVPGFANSQSVSERLGLITGRHGSPGTFATGVQYSGESTLALVG